MQVTITSLENQIEAFNIERTELLMLCEERQRMLIVMQSQQDVFKQTKTEVEENLRAELLRSEGKVQHYTTKCEMLLDENEQLRAEVQSQDTQRETWEERLSEFTSALSSLKVDCEMREEQIRVLQIENQELQNLNNVLKSMTSERESNNNIDRRIDLLREENTRLIASRNDHISAEQINSESI
jgi:chromosome segregation ATPase